MKNTLITGVNGLVGSALAKQLLSEGLNVKGLVRNSSDLRSISDLDIELLCGDIRDKDFVLSSFTGIDTVFHTAAVISHWRRERDLMFSVNVEGTRNVVGAALASNIRRFIHTSSIAALPLGKDGEQITEETPHTGDFLDVGYRISKYRSEKIVLDAVGNGLNAVVLNPAVIMGPGDYRFHGGRIIRDIYKGRIFYAPPGGTSVVNVDDVAKAHIAAARTGRVGEKYILAGENLTFRQLFTQTADVVGGVSPVFTVPVPVVRAVATVSEGIGRIYGTKPWVTRELVAGIQHQKLYSSEKAHRELGFNPASFRETADETFRWYKMKGLL